MGNENNRNGIGADQLGIVRANQINMQPVQQGNPVNQDPLPQNRLDNIINNHPRERQGMPEILRQDPNAMLRVNEEPQMNNAQVEANRRIQEQVAPAVVMVNGISMRERMHCQLPLPTEINTLKDSSQMQAVKRALQELNQLVEGKILDQENGDLTDLHQKLTEIQEKYIIAIGKCRIYLKERAPKINVASARVKMVRNTMEQLKKEANSIAELRKDIVEYPESYGNYKDSSFLEMLDSMDNSKKIRTAVNNLELQDYVQMITNREDQIYFKNGKICRKNGNSKDMDGTEISKENFAMVQHLIMLMMNHQKTTTPEQTARIKRNLLLGMGADLTNEVCGPVSMSRVMDLLAQFSSYSSDVDRVLCEQKEFANKPVGEQSLEYRTASRIHKLLGNTYTRKGKETSKDLESRLKEQILAIMNKSTQREGWSLLKLKEEELDYLVKGRLQTVRDKVYNSMMHIYKQKSRLKEGPVEELNDDDIRLLLALTISDTMADEHDLKTVMGIQLNRFEENQILSVDQELGTYFPMLYVDELERINIKALRDYVHTYPGKFKKASAEKLEDGLIAATKIISNMQEIRVLEHKGLHQGLSQEEAFLLGNMARENVRLYSYHLGNINLIRDGFDRRTYIYKGLENLERNFNDKTIELGNNYADYVAEKLKKSDKKNPLDDNQNKEKKQIELVTENEALRFATKELSPKAAAVISAVFLDAKPAKLIKKAGDRNSQDIMKLHDAILELSQLLKEKKEGKADVSVAGTTIVLKQDKSGILSVQIGTKELTLPCNARYWLEMLESDICSNFARYHQDTARQLLLKITDRDANPQKVENRLLYERFFTYHLGIPAEDLTNVPVYILRGLVRGYCFNLKKEDVLDTINKCNQNALNKTHINSMAAIENLVALENMRKNLKKSKVINKIKPLKIEKDYESWSEEEKAYLDIMGELYFQRGVQDQLDETKTYDADRLTKAIRGNLQKFVTVLNLDVSKREAICEGFQNFPAFKGAAEAANQMIEEIIQTGLTGRKIELNLDKQDAGKYSGQATEEAVEAALKAKEVKEILGKTAKKMQNSVAEASASIQKILKDAAEDMGDDATDDDWKDIRDLTVSELLARGVTGKEGEGAFNKEVLKGYVEKAKPADKQKMLASALRNAPKFSQKFMERDDATEMATGKFMAGYIKGAGPLLHKMLQGLPVSSMPPELQMMVSDVRSNLMEIDENIVDAELQNIIDESDGAIDHIEKLAVLGAASVGETILVKVFETGNEEGVEKVVKILRPDVQNHMSREIDFMEGCAKTVDANMRAQKKKKQQNAQNAQNQEDQQNILNVKKQQDKQNDQNVQNQQEQQNVQNVANRPDGVIVQNEMFHPIENQQNIQIVQNQENGQNNQNVQNQENRQNNQNVQNQENGQNIQNVQNAQNQQEAQEGGMLKTFRGKVRAIKRELDLRLEADNVLQGKVYEDEFLHIKSMSLGKNTTSSIHSLVLEKAEGQSVDKYIQEMNGKRVHIDTTGANIYSTVKELDQFRDELKNKQQYLYNLLGKWIEEAIFGSGFFHGDLHAGNIMMSEEGVTVIDYGNANRLTKKERKHILNLLASVEGCKTNRALKHIRALLSKEDSKMLKNANAAYIDELRTIIRKDDGAGVEKVLVVLNKLQKSGVEIPAGLYNFIQCFVRIMGTITDHKNLINNVDVSIQQAMKSDGTKTTTITQDPEYEILPSILKKLTKSNKEVSDKDIEKAVKKAMVSKEPDMNVLVAYADNIANAEQSMESYQYGMKKMPDIQRMVGGALLINQAFFVTLPGERGVRESLFKVQHNRTLDPREIDIWTSWFRANEDFFKRGFRDALIDKGKKLEEKITDLEQQMNNLLDEGALAELQQELNHSKAEMNFYSQCIKEVNQLLPTIQKSISEIEEYVKKIHKEDEKAEVQKENALKEDNIKNEEDDKKWKEEAEKYNKKSLETFNAILTYLQKLSLGACNSELERNFMNTYFKFLCTSPAVQSGLNNEDKKIIESEHDAAKDETEILAKEISSKSQMPTYSEKIVALLVNDKERKQLGESLKNWFADSSIGGEALKAAYNNLVQAAAVSKIEEKSKSVVEFMEAYTNCVIKRTSNILRISNKSKFVKNGEEEEDVLFATMKSNLKSSLGMLDGYGVSYKYFKHELTEAEKIELQEGKVRRRTEHVRNMYNDMEGSVLLNSTRSLHSDTLQYESLMSTAKWHLDCAQDVCTKATFEDKRAKEQVESLKQSVDLNTKKDKQLTNILQKNSAEKEKFVIDALVKQSVDNVTQKIKTELGKGAEGRKLYEELRKELDGEDFNFQAFMEKNQIVAKIQGSLDPVVNAEYKRAENEQTQVDGTFEFLNEMKQADKLQYMDASNVLETMVKSVLSTFNLEQKVRNTIQSNFNNKDEKSQLIELVLKQVEDKVQKNLHQAESQYEDSVKKAKKAEEKLNKAQEKLKYEQKRGGLSIRDKKEKRKLVNKMNSEIQEIMQKISTIRFGTSEKKRISNLFKKYEKKPSVDAIANIMKEVGTYIEREFQDTDYTTTHPNGDNLDNRYSPLLTDRDILPKTETIEFQLEEQKEGEKHSLMQRLQKGEQIQWIKQDN